MTNKKEFEKNTGPLTKEIFDKYNLFFEASKRIKNLRIPKPITFSKQKIIFEYVNIHNTIHDQILSSHVDKRIFYKIGFYLGQLHEIAGEGIPRAKKTPIHGDFWAGNISLKNNTFVFFDFEPPHSAKNKKIYLFNHPYLDVAHFLFRLKNIYEIERPSLALKIMKSETNCFLEGYAYATKKKIDKERLKKYYSFVRREDIQRLRSYSRPTIKRLLVELFMRFKPSML